MKRLLMIITVLYLMLSGCTEDIDKIDYTMLEDEIFFQLDEIYKNPELEKNIPNDNFEHLLSQKRVKLFSKRFEALQKANNKIGAFYEEYYYNRFGELFGNNYPLESYELKSFVRLRESELGLAEYDNVTEAVVAEETKKDFETGHAEYRLETNDEYVVYMTTDDNTVFRDDENYYYTGHIYFGGIPNPVGMRVRIHYNNISVYDEDNEKVIKALLIEQLDPKK